jgi:hypothetical protein
MSNNFKFVDIVAIFGLAWWPFFQFQRFGFCLVTNGSTNTWLSLLIIYYYYYIYHLVTNKWNTLLIVNRIQIY